MENEPSDLRESLWRRQAASKRPDVRTKPELELEARLTDALARLPDVPVASNFTSRVMAAIDREDAKATRSAGRWNWQMFLPRVALAATVLFIAGIGIHQHQISSRHIALARNVATVTASHPLPSVTALEDLDAIQRMSQSSHADGELLADLQ